MDIQLVGINYFKVNFTESEENDIRIQASERGCTTDEVVAEIVVKGIKQFYASMN